MRYQVCVEPFDGAVRITSQDLPELASVGSDVAHALNVAAGDILLVLASYIRARKQIPVPKAGRAATPSVRVPAQAACKILLHNAALEQGLSKAELGRRLGISDAQIARLFDVRHSSRLSSLEAALSAVGKEITITGRRQKQT